MNRDDWVFAGVLAFAVIAIIIGVVVSEKADRLEVENKVLKDQNHMLKTTLENLGAEIEKLSTRIDKLNRAQNRGNDWNENVEEF